MPQDRVNGADTNAYGRETVRKIATAIGTVPMFCYVGDRDEEGESAIGSR